MGKKVFFISLCLLFCGNIIAQTTNSHLLFQFFGVNENQSEMNYISYVLETNNITTPGPDQEKVITEARNYYRAHKEEIDMNTKAEELVQFRDVVEHVEAEAWLHALGAISGGITGALTAIQQQADKRQETTDDGKKEQSIISQPTTSYSVQNTQNIGTFAGTTAMNSPSSQQPEQTIEAIYAGQGGLNNLLIRVQGDKVVAYCSGRDYQGRQIWDNIQPVQIYPNNGGARTSNSTVNRETASKKQRAQLGQLTLYF